MQKSKMLEQISECEDTITLLSILNKIRAQIQELLKIIEATRSSYQTRLYKGIVINNIIYILLYNNSIKQLLKTVPQETWQIRYKFSNIHNTYN